MDGRCARKSARRIARSDPYTLVQPITRIVRAFSADQPVERTKTLDDIRAEVLSPERLNAMVSGVFAGVALLIAVVGVAGSRSAPLPEICCCA
ncbi:MAG: hypothetical protein JWP63_5887 [Candidatus Solibacter sp.]|nr:hypothetical protein [Candidatus Solibacter sp.]